MGLISFIIFVFVVIVFVRTTVKEPQLTREYAYALRDSASALFRGIRNIFHKKRVSINAKL